MTFSCPPYMTAGYGDLWCSSEPHTLHVLLVNPVGLFAATALIDRKIEIRKGCFCLLSCSHCLSFTTIVTVEKVHFSVCSLLTALGFFFPRFLPAVLVYGKLISVIFTRNILTVTRDLAGVTLEIKGPSYGKILVKKEIFIDICV